MNDEVAYCEKCSCETPYDNHGNCMCCGEHINEGKTEMKKFEVHYSFYMSDSVEVEAENEREAEDKVRTMIEVGEIAEDLNKMEIGDSEVWVD